MRLQRLELSGFKSFPDRAELAFDQGVTAIVGPNGCGKSNIVDAITWVLGEQSARSLRGDRMEDVIFSGSDARKPTAAAEVRLKLAGVTSAVPARLFTPRGGNGHGRGADRTRGDAHGNGHDSGGGTVLAVERGPDEPAALPLDLDETPPIVRDVEVSRRLYRSGESEYLIDGEVCRLRDVHDLLMDAGLGIKAYAVIEQGKIGQILSARPTERRQLIEEAAGVTKYKSRRRAAELKLEAAQQNLTRVDDIVYEVEKQRGALRRQAAKARRHQRLRDELRRWERVLFARRYRQLAQEIEMARARLAEARAREAAAAARLAEIEAHVERLRIELAEADHRATAAREAAHARELDIGRRQQQIEFDWQQVRSLDEAAATMAAELQGLEARREPVRAELAARQAVAAGAEEARTTAARRLADEETAYQGAYRELEGLESDVEAARSEVFSAMNAATALQHAVVNATSAHDRLGDQIAKLEIERADLTVEAERARQERLSATQALARARATLEQTRLACAARESELVTARTRRDEVTRQGRALEQGLAALEARLASLEELDAARAGYGDAARLILAESNGRIGHLGSVADYLEVDRRYERAVEACLGDRLEYVVVRRHEHAAAGLAFVRERDAGRCGFLIVETPLAADADGRPASVPTGLVPLASVLRVNGPHAPAIRAALGDGWIAESFDDAAAAAIAHGAIVATLAGDVFHGAARVYGGTRGEARGILAPKREIKELRERVAGERLAVEHAAVQATALEASIATAEAAAAAFHAEIHQQEKAMVALEGLQARALEDADRIGRKHELVSAERARAGDEQHALEARQTEARESIRRLEGEQRLADDRFADAQRRLFTAREALEARSAGVAEAKAAHAALVERAAGLVSELRRIEEATRDLEERVTGRTEERRRALDRKEDLVGSIARATQQLDQDIRTFETLKHDVRDAEARCASIREEFNAQDQTIREARRVVEVVRDDLSHLEVKRATAESDLAHLAQSCLETVHASLDDVAADVDRMEQAGELDAPAAVVTEPDTDEEGVPADAAGATGAPAPEGEQPPASDALTPEAMVARLRAKVDRLGPVNMMAIEQFDDLESRHAFLTGQRQDLVESIAATGEAIRRIDRTTRERFQEAFVVINEHFQQTFTTLFGGGRAGLLLLDEADELESGIDIIAQPPGKRLQSVQLLSGGEKALTAMALMFALFKYRPSPFCLLDEIDAPLDDANIGRFVEMLQGMQSHTQFVLITHNRKTMEIADRLYGVTMEEPGVSKLISVQVN